MEYSQERRIINVRLTGIAESFSAQSASSVRLKVAQRFIAGGRFSIDEKSVKRTADWTRPVAFDALLVSRPLHGLVHFVTFPSSELLGYYHSSAIADWAKDF